MTKEELNFIVDEQLKFKMCFILLPVDDCQMDLYINHPNWKIIRYYEPIKQIIIRTCIKEDYISRNHIVIYLNINKPFYD